MIAISSLRPFADSESYAKLQIQAHQSWLTVFDEIIYVCKTGEDALRHPKTTFILDDRPFIPIKVLAEIASLANANVAAVINSDIVVTQRLGAIKDSMAATCHPYPESATSRRWTFYGDRRDELKLLPGDNGLDIFLTTPHIWRYVAANIPESYCLGLPGWDEWLMRTLAARNYKGLRDFTPYRCILHPFHTERAPKPAIAVEQFSGPPPTVLAL